MIYLDREWKAFDRTQQEFASIYQDELKRMFAVFSEKAKVRDRSTPIHHRQSPAGQLGIAQAKCRRVETLMSKPDWSEVGPTLDDIREECGDAANYLMYISTLCAMLQKEQAE